MAGRKVFHELPEPASPQTAMDALYDAFADWPKPEGPFCDRCFTQEDEARILQPTPPCALAPRDFVGIFHEHLACSVGYEGFFHFLPRALETLLFDLDIYPDIADLAADGGLHRLRERRRAALAVAAATTLRTFFAGQMPQPFAAEPGSSAVAMPYFQAKAGARLVKLMLVLQVDPWEVFQELSAIGGDIVWNTFAAVLEDGRWIPRSDAARVGVDVWATIDRIAWIDFSRVVDPATFASGCKRLDPGGARSRRPHHAAARYRERTAAVAGLSRRRLVGQLGDLLGEARRDPL